MKIKHFAKFEHKSVLPEPETLYTLYSLPAYDQNREAEVCFGKQIQSNKFLVPSKCILFNKLNVRFKRIWPVEHNQMHCIASTEFLPLVIDESKVDFYYAYFLLQSDIVTDYFEGQNRNTSGSHKRIDVDNFFDLDLSVPDLEIQRRIGSLLWNIDRKIELNKAINHNLPTPDRSSTAAKGCRAA